LGAPTQRKAHPQVGCPNARPQRKARPHARKLGAPTQHKARPQRKARSQRKARHVRNARHVRKLGGPTHVRNARHVRNLGAPTQRKARLQDGRPNAKLIRNENVHTREHWAKRRAGGRIRTNFGLEVDFLIRPHQGWAPQRNARRVRKMGAQTQRKAISQDGRPNENLIRNENVHTREH
jgi:hypothetical protein